MAWPKGKPRKPAAQTEDGMDATDTATAVVETPQAPSLSGDQFQQLIAALTAQAQSAQPLTADTLKTILTETATLSAQTMQKAIKPENETHPGISVYSHPDGDQLRPKPPLPYQLFWDGYPVHKFPETETWYEWELYGQLQPGEFRVLRVDGTLMKVSIKAEKDAQERVTRLQVECVTPSRDEKRLTPPRSVVLYQLIHPDNLPLRYREAYNKHLSLVLGG